ncbi:M28 family metallopeptidase [Agromyces sp. NPDC056523]|uniref:M28 family metallopeptidase n=1 Tax=Agromyces sp. NPDC056523 TaxID=3345850 RepID=UPI00366D044A
MSRTARISRRAGVLATATAVVGALALVPAGGALAAPPANTCDARNNNTVAKALECIDADGAWEHLEALQAIADANGGNRAAGTEGYEDSVDYVVERLEAAGWNVTIDEFDFTFVGPSTLQQLDPVNATYETGPFTASGSGTVEGNVIPIDIVLGQPNDTVVTSGCEASDYAGIDWSGDADIALIQRGTCEFGIKAGLAEQAGAEAVIIFNQGNTPERSGLIVGTLIGANTLPITIPVVGASYEQGVALAQAGSTARIVVPEPEERPQKNVIAELPGKNDDNVVMAGAHLDSVQAGPGINDNGSGSAALLEIAESLSKLKPENTLRFAWWGAEESGLLGSQAYVDELATMPGELDRIALYLNFDMVASPNFIYMVYDGDESSFEAPVVVPEGSIEIEDVFESYFTSQGIPYDDAEFSGRSDYEAFILAGIPAGGLFTGAEVVKTEEQEAIWGGIAGEQYDQCYHLACDTIDNPSEEALDVNIDAMAFAILAFAYDTSVVNGVAGKNVPGGISFPTPAGPEMTVGSGGGHEHGEVD